MSPAALLVRKERSRVTEQPTHHNGRSRRVNGVLIGFLAVAGFFLFTEHRAHVFGILPYVLLLACLMMPLFMHGGHGHGGGHPPSSGTAASNHPAKGDLP